MKCALCDVFLNPDYACFPSIREMDKTNGKPVNRADVERFAFHASHKAGQTLRMVELALNQIDAQLAGEAMGRATPARKPNHLPPSTPLAEAKRAPRRAMSARVA